MALAESDASGYLAAYAPTLSLTEGGNLYRWALKPEPAAQVALIPVPGLESEGGFGKDGLRWEAGRFQVVSRAENAIDAFNTAHACFLAFWKVEAETVGGTFYHWMRPAQRPFSIGADANGREMIAFNVDWKRDLGA